MSELCDQLVKHHFKGKSFLNPNELPKCCNPPLIICECCEKIERIAKLTAALEHEVDVPHCQHLAGSGTVHPGSGYCWEHDWRSQDLYMTRTIRREE